VDLNLAGDLTLNGASALGMLAASAGWAAGTSDQPAILPATAQPSERGKRLGNNRILVLRTIPAYILNIN